MAEEDLPPGTAGSGQLSVLPAKNGIKEPIKFVEHNGKRYVVDGHHRLRAAKELGLKDVPVEEVTLPFKGYKGIDDLNFSR